MPIETHARNRPTKRERDAANYYLDSIMQIEHDVLNHVLREQMIPKEWHHIAEHPRHEKRRVTIRLDADVIDFFKSMGPGYQTKMNTLLRSWMQGRIARMIEGPDTTDWLIRADQVSESRMRRPQFGDAADIYQATRLRLEQDRLIELLTDERDKIREEEAALAEANADAGTEPLPEVDAAVTAFSDPGEPTYPQGADEKLATFAAMISAPEPDSPTED